MDLESNLMKTGEFSPDGMPGHYRASRTYTHTHLFTRVFRHMSHMRTGRRCETPHRLNLKLKTDMGNAELNTELCLHKLSASITV